MRVTVTPKDEERLVVLMARERPRSAVVAPGGDLVTAGGGGGGGGAGAGAAAQQRSRVWMGYSMPRNYAPAFHSFAWAQAVQNKPLVPRNAAADEDEVEHVVDTSDEEKEEGEIEEGEAGMASSSPPRAQPETIDLDADAPEKSESVAVDGSGAPVGAEEDEVDFDQRVGSILEELEMVSIEEAEKSFEGACTRLRTCFENLKPLFPESGSPMPMLDALVQQAFVGIDTITSVAISYDMPKREQTKNMLLKLLFHIKNRYSAMLTPDQRDELDSRVRQLVFEDGKDNANGPSATPATNTTNVGAPSGQVLSERLPFESRAGNSFSGSSMLKVEIPAKNRIVSPLLDLHADYDENSLPSPTRDSAPPFPVPKPIGFSAFPMPPERPSFMERVEPTKNPSYPSLNDALKAVSSYQQKYGQKSTFASDDLPSPTPSGDGDKSGDKGGDTFGEVSSFSASNKTALPIVNQMPSSQTSTISSSDNFAGGPPGYAKQIENPVSGSNHVPKLSAKSRDPRLKFLNRDPTGVADVNRRVNFAESNPSKDRTMGAGVTRKHKADEPLVDENMSKRSRGGFGDPRDMLAHTGRGGWARDGGNISSYPSDGFQPNQNTRLGNSTTGSLNLRADSAPVSNTKNMTNSSGTSSGIVQAPQTNPVPQTSSAPAVSLPAMLKDIAVNPAMLVHWIQMEQQKMSAAEPQQKVTVPVGMASNVSTGTVLPLGNAPKTTEVAPVSSVRPQVPIQTATGHVQNDAGVIRMKPRDPRRILHSNIAQKNDTVPPVCVEQAKSNGTALPDSQGSKDHLPNHDQQAVQPQTSALPSQSVSSVRPATVNVNPVSNSQLAATALMPHGDSQKTSSSVNKADPRLAAGQNESNGDAKTSTGPATAPDSVPPASPWGELDHLLDGYDDQQKALIQKERARRIMEQQKMFAARKLCLVLDLDHTLLNSAKFLEVDHIHEEILRKKEEQDRERAERHLFCFHHMGMWTKLRPGIWNFLEKASKLYELHLYTMGNKVYATEMAKVLDPTGALFAGRVISRGDDGDNFDSDERVPKSKDLDGVLGMESAVVIIDDSVRVWPHNKHNLIVVERYTYFPCSRRQFGLPGPSLLEIDRDERPEDGTLASSLAVIERIHQNFFSHPNLNDADVRSILASEQQSILGGCRIVFSRIFPVGEANPHMHPLWQTAEQFGAVCTNQIDDRVTHVVANSLGTDKVNWALSTGRFVVHPGWVEASALLYRRASELDFAVK
uniref:protein-serine/threonine phosphatase n=1 Tax=Leersia perrieri TaxID=77586 RepID=A0A0D9XSG4_9ORYZ